GAGQGDCDPASRRSGAGRRRTGPCRGGGLPRPGGVRSALTLLTCIVRARIRPIQPSRTTPVDAQRTDADRRNRRSPLNEQETEMFKFHQFAVPAATALALLVSAGSAFAAAPVFTT